MAATILGADEVWTTHWPLRQISSARTPSTPATANPGSALVAPRALPEQFQSALQDLIPRCETSQGFCGSRGALTCGAGPICRRWTVRAHISGQAAAWDGEE